MSSYYNQELERTDSVVALLCLEDGRYILQLRDDKPDIWFPGHWGCFGGGIDCNEDPEEAIRRELNEELKFTNPSVTLFDTLALKDHKYFLDLVFRYYFEVPVSNEQMNKFILDEGVEFKAYFLNEIKIFKNVVPFDSFVMWLHSE